MIPMEPTIGKNREFPLKELAYFEIERGLLKINHLDGKREISVEADLAGAGREILDHAGGARR